MSAPQPLSAGDDALPRFAAGRSRVARLASAALERQDPKGWFEELYTAAQGDPDGVPWFDGLPNPLFLRWLEARAEPGSGRPALVVAMGLGDDSEELVRRGWDVTGFDISPTAVEWCRRLHPDSAARYQVADLTALPLDWSDRFDLVVEVYTLQALPSSLHGRCWQELARCLASDGRLVVVCRSCREDQRPDGPPWPLTRAQVEAACEAGLELVSLEEILDDQVPPVARILAEFKPRR